MSGQAESELTLDVEGGALGVLNNVPIEEGVADESPLVSLSYSLAYFSLGFESEGGGFFGSLGADLAPYVVSMLI